MNGVRIAGGATRILVPARISCAYILPYDVSCGCAYPLSVVSQRKKEWLRQATYSYWAVNIYMCENTP